MILDDDDDGKLFCNYYFAGTKEETGYEDSSTGADKFGPIRALTINPIQSYVFSDNNVTGEGTEVTRLSHVLGYKNAETIGGTYKDAFFAQITYPATNLLEYIYYPITLPYQKYGIVNVFFSIYPQTDNLADNVYYCEVGYWNNQGTPSVDATQSMDLYSVWGGAAKNNWHSPPLTNHGTYGIWSAETSQDSPLVTIDQSPSPGYSKQGFVRIRTKIGTADSTGSLLISPVTVLYRVEEF
jgi:hypothetical protein